MSGRVEHLAEGVTLHNGDCREVLPTLGKIDAVVTDPPYGIDAARKRGSQRFGWRDFGVDGWDATRVPKETITAVLRAAGAIIIWGGNYYIDCLEAGTKWLIWDKGQTDFSLADCELAWCSFDGAIRRLMVPRSIALLDGKEHPTQKSLAVMKWCIEQLPPPCDSNSRPIHGLWHDRRCRRQTRPQVYRNRDRAEILRHRVPSRSSRAGFPRHVR